MGRSPDIRRLRRLPVGSCRWGTGIAVVAACVGMSQAAHADEPLDDELADPRAGTARPAAEDLRAGSLRLSGYGGLSVPSGSVTVDVAAPDVAGIGPVVGGRFDLGFSRYGSVGAQGEYASYGSSDRCSTCAATSLAVGLGFRYHLTQALAVDPYIGIGAGYRFAEYTVEEPLTGRLEDFVGGTYHGLDVVRFEIGASYFPARSLGFGPYFSADFGTYVDRPDGARNNAAYAFVGFGVRFVFEPTALGGPAVESASDVALAPLDPTSPVSPRPVHAIDNNGLFSW